MNYQNLMGLLVDPERSRLADAFRQFFNREDLDRLDSSMPRPDLLRYAVILEDFNPLDYLWINDDGFYHPDFFALTAEYPHPLMMLGKILKFYIGHVDRLLRSFTERTWDYIRKIIIAFRDLYRPQFDAFLQGHDLFFKFFILLPEFPELTSEEVTYGRFRQAIDVALMRTVYRRHIHWRVVLTGILLSGRHGEIVDGFTFRLVYFQDYNRMEEQGEILDRLDFPEERRRQENEDHFWDGPVADSDDDMSESEDEEQGPDPDDFPPIQGPLLPDRPLIPQRILGFVRVPREEVIREREDAFLREAMDPNPAARGTEFYNRDGTLRLDCFSWDRDDFIPFMFMDRSRAESSGIPRWAWTSAVPLIQDVEVYRVPPCLTQEEDQLLEDIENLEQQLGTRASLNESQQQEGQKRIKEE